MSDPTHPTFSLTSETGEIIKTPITTLIFDMDVVIVDSEHLHCQAWIQAYQELGIPITEDYYFSTISGKHGLDSTRIVFEQHQKEYHPAFAASLVLRKDQLASELMKHYIPPIPGVVETIKRFAKSYKLGLGSTSSMVVVNTILTKFAIDDKFSVIISGEGVKQGKPHPEVYEKIAKLLEEDPHHCIVIEDSKSGIMAAKSAGMKCIAILNSRNKKEDLVNADVVISSFAELSDELIASL